MPTRNLRTLLLKYIFDGEILRLMALIMLVKPLDMITQILMAKYFGAGSEYDAYALAIFVVLFIHSVLGHVFTSVIVPFIIKLRSALDAHRVMGFQNTIIAVYGLLAIVTTISLGLFAGAIVDTVGPGLSDETQTNAIRMVHFLAIAGAMALLVAMGKAVLNLNNKYRLATGMPMMHTAVILAAIILLHDILGIWSMVVGFIVSQLLQTILVWGRAIACSHVITSRLHVPVGSLGKLWTLSWALLLTQTFLLLYQFIDKIFASTLETGSISSLAYAATIKTFGVQLFQFSLVTIMFTRLSEFIASSDFDGCGQYIKDNIIRVSRLVVPAALVFCLASGEIVRVLYMRGAFDAADAERTTGVMAMYALGMPAFTLNLIISRTFHSLQRMKEKIWLGVQYLVTNVVGNLLLIGPMKLTGLALASTITIYIHLLLSMWVLHRYRLGLGVAAWFGVFLKYHAIAAATYLVYALAGFGSLMEAWSIRGTTAGDLVICCCKAAFVCLVYGGLLYLWRVMLCRGADK